MKTPLTILAIAVAVMGTALAAVLMGQFRANRDLRNAIGQLQTDLKSAQASAASAQIVQRETAAQLHLAQTVTEQLRAKLAEFDSTAARSPSNAPPIAKPYQAEAYLGQQWLGTGWIIPRNLRVDTNTQRYVYEPVIWLDESLRNNFILHHTNVVEREIETQTTYNNTYYPTPFYYFGYPSHGRPHPDPAPPDWPPMPQPYPTPPAFNPGSGTVTPPKLGTPAEKIRIYPQNVSQPPAAPTTPQR